MVIKNYDYNDCLAIIEEFFKEDIDSTTKKSLATIFHSYIQFAYIEAKHTGYDKGYETGYKDGFHDGKIFNLKGE